MPLSVHRPVGTLVVPLLLLSVPAGCVRLGFAGRPLDSAGPDLGDASGILDAPAVSRDSGSLADSGALADTWTQPDGTPNKPDAKLAPDTSTTTNDLGASPDAGVLKIISSPVTLVGKLSTYQYDAQANRPDPLSWSVLVGPAGMKIDKASGLVTWTHNAVLAVHSVSIQVQKGAETATQDFKVTVVAGSLNGLSPAELHAGLDRLPALARVRLPGVPPTRRLERYVVDCARELAPGWRDGPCDRGCQERVSACVLARVNALGRSIPVLLDPPAGAAEGAFFGNLFSEPPSLFSCGGDRAPPRALGRECALPDNRCGVTWAGPCSAVCAGDGRRIARCGRYTRIVTVRAAAPVTVP